MSLKVAAQIVGFVNGLQTLFHPLIYYTTKLYIYIYTYRDITADIPCLYSIYVELGCTWLTKYLHTAADQPQDHSGAICRGEDENEL